MSENFNNHPEQTPAQSEKVSDAFDLSQLVSPEELVAIKS